MVHHGRLRRRFERLLNAALRPMGLGVHRRAQMLEARRARFLEAAGVELVLDVGAFRGTYARELRRSGYTGRIVSFEPLQGSFRDLLAASARDDEWECLRLAIGDVEGEMDLHVSENLVSSSALPMLERHLQAAPQSRYVGRERVPQRRLDSVLADLPGGDEVLGIKADVQGYEDRVLAGAEEALERTRFVELELSLVPLYESGPLLCEMVGLLESRGFTLAAWGEAFVGRGVRTLQIDGIFLRD